MAKSRTDEQPSTLAKDVKLDDQTDRQTEAPVRLPDYTGVIDMQHQPEVRLSTNRADYSGNN